MTAIPLISENTSGRGKRDKLLQSWGALDTERSGWITHWQDITKNLLPRSGRYLHTDRNRSGRDKYNDIIDSTGTKALRVLGAGMMGGVSSPSRPWFRMQTADPDLNEFHPVKLWLSDVVRRMLRVFQRSNTYRTLHMMYEELAAFGTSVSILLPDGEKIIHHYPSPTGEYALRQNWQGRVSALYRRFERSVAEVVKEFGKDNVSEHARNMFERGTLEAPIDILHVIEPRADRDSSKADNLNMPFKSVYLEISGQRDPDKFLREGGFERFPVLAPRWAVLAGDVYGHSPGMESLGDIRQLQQEQVRKSEAIDYQTKPPLQVPTDLKGVDREALPGGISWYEPGGIAFHNQGTPQGGIRTQFEVNLDLAALREDIAQVQERIRQAYFADLFLMLATAPVTSRMTATEVAQRFEEKLVMLGPVLDRVHNELLEPMVDITFTRMFEAGLIPPPPPDLAGQELDVEFVSILAQAQKSIGLNAIDRFLGSMRAVAEVKPDVLDKFNTDKWADIYSDDLGVDPRLIVSDETANALREQRNRAIAAQEQAAMMQQQASTAKDLSSASTEEASLLTELASS